jgi:hypothetical protein
LLVSRPQRYLVRMFVFLVVVAALVAALAPALKSAFEANLVLNGIIAAVLLIGVLYIFRQVGMLGPEVSWIDRYRHANRAGLSDKLPRLLSPLANVLGERSGRRIQLTPVAMRTLLDGISARLDEQRETSRYLIGVLVFLGLLGTFYGLLLTVRSVGDVVANLSGGGGDIEHAMAALKASLKTPLDGMATAFSSSLFGLAGSLILGFLDLQAGQAQNRFFNELEEWLSGLTRLGSSMTGDGEQPVPAFIQALLEQTADSLDNLQRIMTRGEEGRVSANQSLQQLSDRLGTMTEQMHVEQNVLLKLAETQQQLRGVLSRLADAPRPGEGVIGIETRDYLRSLDSQVARLTDIMSVGRDETIREMRQEIRLLARTIAAAADGADRTEPPHGGHDFDERNR